MHRRTLAIREKALGPDHPLVLLSLNNLAMQYYGQGQYDKTEQVLLRVLASAERTLGPEHPTSAGSLNNLAALYEVQSRYAEAEQMFLRVLALKEKTQGMEHPDLAVTLSNLASLYSKQSQYAKAEPLYQRALAILEKVLGADHPDLTVHLNNLAVLYRSQGQDDKAIPILQRALEIQEKALGMEHPDVASVLHNLAGLYSNLGQKVQAESLNLRALAIEEKTIGPNHPKLAISLSNLALLYMGQERREEAWKCLRRALCIAVAGGRPDTIRWAESVSRTLHAVPNTDLAIFYGKQAVNTLQGVRARNIQMDMAAQRGFLRENEHDYKHLAELLLSRNRLAEAQQILAMLKEAEYHEFNGEDAGDDPRRSRAAYSPREAKLDERFRELAGRLRAAEPKSAEFEALRREFETFLDELEAAFAPDTPGEPNRLENKSPMQTPLAELGPGTALVQYLLPHQWLWILVTTGDGMIARRSAFGAEALKRKIKEFRDAVANRQADVRERGRTLYDLLIAPIAGDLEAAEAHTLMLAPDGELRYLPFAALHDGEKYLVERYTLANFTDMTKEHITDRPVADWNFAGFGVSRAVGGHSALPAVPDELNGIRDNAIPGEIRLDGDFTGQTLREALNRPPPVVHLATHFVFEKGDEQASYLQLGDGGRLTLADIRGGYRFRDVDLVALSACDTAVGGGEEKDGREVEGLGVLVQRQGAKGVLASLWPVNDESTGRFMRLFYGYRQQAGLSKAAALQQTQRAFIEGRVETALVEVDRNRGRVPAGERVGAPVTARPARSSDPAHPYFWAPFILMGNWL